MAELISKIRYPPTHTEENQAGGSGQGRWGRWNGHGQTHVESRLLSPTTNLGAADTSVIDFEPIRFFMTIQNWQRIDNFDWFCKKLRFVSINEGLQYAIRVPQPRVRYARESNKSIPTSTSPLFLPPSPFLPPPVSRKFPL